MENETPKPVEKKKTAKEDKTKSDGIIVTLVKQLLNLNFLKWGVTKNF